jgi:DTW domain-containing protein YfiP
VTSLTARERPELLLVPDGIWSQARRMVRRDFAQAGIECVSLAPAQLHSEYDLRRRSGGQLCTFEAVAHALAAFGAEDVRDALLSRFRVWLERARAVRRGEGAPRPLED